jgi:hypothetical protein
LAREQGAAKVIVLDNDSKAWFKFALMMILIVGTTSFFVYNKNLVYANKDNSVVIAKDNTLRDSAGNNGIVGLVKNNGLAPVKVNIGVETITKNGTSDKLATVLVSTYASTIYPHGETPFKFIIDKDKTIISKPFIMKKIIQTDPYYDVIKLNYSNLPIGSNKALTGTATNVGPFEIKDLSVYAAANDIKGNQVDSVKSNKISTIKPGQSIAFTAVPDTMIKSKIYYFSCAGLSFLDPITTLKTANGGYIAYDLQATAKISDIKYDDRSNGITFGVKHYNPYGGMLALKIPEFSEKQIISVQLDGKPYSKTDVNRDGKTIFINIFVPPQDHQLKILGIRDVRS